MFGYVLPEKPELKVREYEMFKAYYCGVCKTIGKKYGQLPRAVLNYDCTFLALLLSSLARSKPVISRERCITHPAAKRNIARKDPAIEYASDMNVLLAYYNLEDKWKDDRSIAAAAGKVMLKNAFKRIRRKYPQKCDIIEDKLKELALLEKTGCSSVDRAAEPFAQIMETVMVQETLTADEKAREAVRWLGYNLGRWIYILDAYDDLEKDCKKKVYNPFIFQYNYQEGDISELKERIRPRVEFSLTFTLNEISKAFELLDLKENRGIVENIVYMGMLRKTEQILKTGSCRHVEQSV